MVRLLALMCEIKSMQEITREFNTKEAIENIATICGLNLEEIPHCDTINDVFRNVKVSEIEEIRKYMIVKMIRNKMLSRFKIRGAIPTLYREFETIVATDNESKIKNYKCVTKLDYKDNKTNIIKYTDEKKRNRIYIYDRFKYNR